MGHAIWPSVMNLPCHGTIQPWGPQTCFLFVSESNRIYDSGVPCQPCLEIPSAHWKASIFRPSWGCGGNLGIGVRIFCASSSRSYCVELGLRWPCRVSSFIPVPTNRAELVLHAVPASTNDDISGCTPYSVDTTLRTSGLVPMHQ
jgi:hypothetical protein